MPGSGPGGRSRNRGRPTGRGRPPTGLGGDDADALCAAPVRNRARSLWLCAGGLEPGDPGLERRLPEAAGSDRGARAECGRHALGPKTQSVRMPKRSATSSAVRSRSMVRSSRTCSSGSRYGMALRSPRPGRVARIEFDRGCERPGAGRLAPARRRRGVEYPLVASRPSAGGRSGDASNPATRRAGARHELPAPSAVPPGIPCRPARADGRGGGRSCAVPRFHARCVARGAAPGRRGHARSPGAAQWPSLAARSRVGARSEEEARRALEPLRERGWRVRHAVAWAGRGDIDSVVIAPRWRRLCDCFLPLVWSSRAPFVGPLVPQDPHVFCPDVRPPACCTCGVAFIRQQVVLPGGQAYWTVLDGDFEVAEPFDGFLRWLRLVNGRAESTTRQYASAFAEWADWLASVGECDDLVRWAERLGAFRFHLMTSPVSRPGSGCGRVRSPERVDGVLAAVRSF